jgi:uncharacterized protein GlcG (DUF336 family)
VNRSATSVSLAALAFVLGTSALWAQSSNPAQTGPALPPPPAAPGPSLELATLAARTALDACTAKGFAVSVSVVDAAGVLKVLLAQDGAHMRGVQSSTNKAVTARSWEDSTSRLGERVKYDAALAKTISANPAYNVRAGGVLLKVKDRIVGAIGVGGAQGSENDEACALAGVAAIQDELNAQFSAR